MKRFKKEENLIAVKYADAISFEATILELSLQDSICSRYLREIRIFFFFLTYLS
jgi:hypothetical protein